MNTKKRASLFGALISILAAMCGCDFLNPNKQIMTKDVPIHLIDPNPEVEHLLSVQLAEDVEADRFWHQGHSKEDGIGRIEQIRTHPESLYPGRKTFLSAMAAQPAESLPANSYVRLLENSNVKCSDPLLTTKFIKVRVTSGSLEGHVGWICEDDVFRTVTMP